MLHLLDWGTGLLLSLVSYELAVLGSGVNILVDCGDGAGDTALRKFLNRSLNDFLESCGVDIALRTLEVGGKN